MNIYFAASISLDRSALPRYREIVEFLKKGKHVVLSEQVVDPTLQAREGIAADQLFQREIAKVEQADLLIAEVSSPSWGTAFLIEHALKNKIPVVALFYKEAKHDLPTMIPHH